MFFAIRDGFHPVKWYPGQHLLGAAGWNGQLLLYDPVRQVRVKTLGPKNDAERFDILSCSWFPPPLNHLVVLGGASGCAEVWDIRAAKLVRSYAEHSPEVKDLPPTSYPNRRAVLAVACSPHGTHIASAGHDSLVRVWQAESGETCFVVDEEETRAGHFLTWLPDGQTLVSGVRSEIMVWNAFSGRMLYRFQTALDYEFRGCQAVSPDGTKIAVATDDKVIIYELTTGHSLLSFVPPGDGYAGSSYTPPDDHCSLVT
jgi:WD40 repeat protein